MAEYIDRELAISLIKQYGHDAIDGGRYSLDTVDDCIELGNRFLPSLWSNDGRKGGCL